MGKTAKSKKAMPRKGTKRSLGKDAPFPLRGAKKTPLGLDYSVISFTTIGEGNAGPKQAVQGAVHSAEELARVFSSGTPPAVDFSKEQAVVVALGEKPTSGFSVRITSIVYFTDRGGDLPPLLSVTYAMKSGKQSSDVMTRPFHAVKVEKLEGEVEFGLKKD
jgi:hypothetical protein